MRQIANVSTSATDHFRWNHRAMWSRQAAEWAQQLQVLRQQMESVVPPLLLLRPNNAVSSVACCGAAADAMTMLAAYPLTFVATELYCRSPARALARELERERLQLKQHTHIHTHRELN